MNEFTKDDLEEYAFATTREQLEDIEKKIREMAIKPDEDGKYNMLDLLKAPFSETYKEILRRNHSEEWVVWFEGAIKERNG